MSKMLEQMTDEDEIIVAEQKIRNHETSLAFDPNGSYVLQEALKIFPQPTVE